MKPPTIDVGDHHPIELRVHVRGARRYLWRLRLAGWLIRLADLVAPRNVNVVEVRQDDQEPAP